MYTKLVTQILAGLFVKSAVKHVIDNGVRDNVIEPAIGSIVYCEIGLGLAEHSGVYIGNGEIIHLNGKGYIERVSPQAFIEDTTALSIYVGCNGRYPSGCTSVADKAIEYERHISTMNYNIMLSNCHQFTTACINHNLENSSTFLWMLKDVCEKELAIDNWRVWKTP